MHIPPRLRAWHTRRTIKKSGLFYFTYYAAQLQDPELEETDLIGHYLRFGTEAGLTPNPLFDSGWYLRAYPDVAAAGFNPLYHYIRHGAG